MKSVGGSQISDSNVDIKQCNSVNMYKQKNKTTRAAKYHMYTNMKSE